MPGNGVNLTLLRMSGGVLAPATPADADAISLMPIGTCIQAKGTAQRNLAFHRRFFALLNLTFEYWEPAGGVVSPAERQITLRFAKHLAQYGANAQLMAEAGEDFLAQLAGSRVERFGSQAEKSFEVMRKWLIAEAGYYTTVLLPAGGMRREAQSIKFGKMDQAAFADLYRAVFGVCWRYVLCRQFETEEAAENAVAQLMGFS
ncbi:MAG: DUF1367 family protein [Aeromonas sp.]